MKIYKLVYNANKPSDKQIVVPNYETNKVGVVVVKDGEKIELAKEDVMLVDGSTEIEADGTYSDMITLPIVTGKFDENKAYKVKIENDDVSLVFNLVVNSVKSSVIEADKDTIVPPYELPIASETVLGGIKVGDNLTIDEDGTLNAEGGEETDPVFTAWKGGTEIAAGSTSAAIGDNSAAYGFHSQGIGDSSLALGAHARAEGQGSVQIGQGTNANDGTFQVGSYQMLDSRGEVPRDRLPLATPTGKGVVKVGDGLTIDSDGKLNAQGSYNAAVIVQPYRGQGEWYISQGQIKEQTAITSPYTDPIVNPPLYFINPNGNEIHTIIIVENGVEERYECVSEYGMPSNYNGTPLFLLAYERGQLYFWGYNTAMYNWADPMPDGEMSDAYTFKRTNNPPVWGTGKYVLNIMVVSMKHHILNKATCIWVLVL